MPSVEMRAIDEASHKREMHAMRSQSAPAQCARPASREREEKRGKVERETLDDGYLSAGTMEERVLPKGCSHRWPAGGASVSCLKRGRSLPFAFVVDPKRIKSSANGAMAATIAAA